MRIRLLVTTAVLIILACAPSDDLSDSTGPSTRPSSAAVTQKVALIDLGTQSYLGLQGGLYEGGSDTPPADHDSAGRAAARTITARRLDGSKDPNGIYILLSIGFSNAAQEWCSKVTPTSFPPCNSWSFTGQASRDAAVKGSPLKIFDGAIGGLATDAWASPNGTAYNTVAGRLAAAGLSEKQVEIVWLKVAHIGPTVSLPASNADAYNLEQDAGAAVRALKVRYPNLALVFISSRIYGGYSTAAQGSPNPEPFAYEGGFSVKWLVNAQIQQRRTGRVDPLAGDLSSSKAPWIGWGPYLWANGTTPRSDGLTWPISDFELDRVHPNTSGETKVGGILLTFFKTQSMARCWFLKAAAQC